VATAITLYLKIAVAHLTVSHRMKSKLYHLDFFIVIATNCAGACASVLSKMVLLGIS
jgi:hypothetical protein